MSDPCDCAGVNVYMLPDGATIDVDVPGPTVTVCLSDGNGNTTDMCLRRLLDKTNAGAGFEWFSLDGTAKAEPASAGSYAACSAFVVNYDDGPGVAADNAAVWMAAWGLTEPVEVVVPNAQDGTRTYWILQDFNDDWHWSRSA